jgi:hypothetical protein
LSSCCRESGAATDFGRASTQPAGREFRYHSPTSRSIAVVYETWNISPPHLGVELWIARWDRSSQKIAWKTRLGIDTLRGYAHTHDHKDVIFTDDQNRIVVIGLGSTWSLDSQSGEILSPIDPQDTALGAFVGIKALRGSIVAVTYDMVDKDGFYTQIIDLASGKKAAG